MTTSLAAFDLSHWVIEALRCTRQGREGGGHQPTAVEFKAFSAVCTHLDCLVAEIKGKDNNCTCRGSKVLYR